MPEKLWPLEGPFYRYKEDVKALARKAGVTVVDSRQPLTEKEKELVADEKSLPKVSLKPEYDPEVAKAAELARSLTAAPKA